MSIVSAFRARTESVVVAQTPIQDLFATKNGYKRALLGTPGESTFVTEGFEVGQEVTAAGYPANTDAGIIEFVTPSELLIVGGRTPTGSRAGRRLTVGLPEERVGSNEDLDPLPGRHYVKMGVVDGGGRMIELPYEDGYREDFGLWVVGWYGISGTAELGLKSSVDALEALFTPGTTLAAGDESYVRMPGAVKSSQAPLINPTAGRALITLTVPWRRFVQNVVVP